MYLPPVMWQVAFLQPVKKLTLTEDITLEKPSFAGYDVELESYGVRMALGLVILLKAWIVSLMEENLPNVSRC